MQINIKEYFGEAWHGECHIYIWAVRDQLHQLNTNKTHVFLFDFSHCDCGDQGSGSFRLSYYICKHLLKDLNDSCESLLSHLNVPIKLFINK